MDIYAGWANYAIEFVDDMVDRVYANIQVKGQMLDTRDFVVVGMLDIPEFWKKCDALEGHFEGRLDDLDDFVGLTNDLKHQQNVDAIEN